MAGLSLDQGWRDRVSVDHAAAALVSAWFGDPPENRAAMAAAVGDLPRAAVVAGGPWQCLAEGDFLAALRQSRNDPGQGQTLAMALAEAEALLSVGAVVSGIHRLQDLHREMYPAATVALARHRHRLGDHIGAMDVAMMLSGHAQTAIIGAKSALISRRAGTAIRFLEPYLSGAASIPDAMVAGGVAIVAASALAKLGQRESLETLATGLLAASDLEDEMLPAVARVAWTAGYAGDAWERFNPELGDWAVAGRLELALLSGNVEAATRLFTQAGNLGAPSRPALDLLSGDVVQPDVAETLFTAGRCIHLWRTHPYRWAPWVAAAQATSAQIKPFDLTTGQIPDVQDLPDIALDDGALVTLLAPVPAAPGPVQGSGVWVEKPLCSGVGIGHDWPATEDACLMERLAAVDCQAAEPKSAAVWVVSADTALAFVASGRRMVVVAPPGDPFWNGPLPERAWPGLHIVRADVRKGWTGGGIRAADAALVLARDGPESETDC